MGGNTGAASRRLCFSRFCLLPAHWLCRNVGFIIVRSQHEVLGASPPTLSRGKQKDRRASGQVVEDTGFWKTEDDFFFFLSNEFKPSFP